MNQARLEELLSRFPQQRIAVLGDFFLDQYLEIDPRLAEPSLETGRVAHQVVGIRRAPGAAGTVVNNLAALGAIQLHAMGAIGNDGEGYELCLALDRLGCSTDGLLRRADLHTPTYSKPCDQGVRGLAGEHDRYDTKNRQPLASDITDLLIAQLRSLLPTLDALIVMDQVELPECGVVSSRLRTSLAELALEFPSVRFWADSRRFIRQYRQMMIKPNEFEAIGRANPLPGDEVPLQDLRNILVPLRAEVGAPVFVTCGEQGILVSDPVPTLVPAVRISGSIDPTGAGDSATAGAVLAMVAGGTVVEAATMGNLVAACTIQQLGTTGTATPAQVLAQWQVWSAQYPRGPWAV